MFNETLLFWLQRFGNILIYVLWGAMQMVLVAINVWWHIVPVMTVVTCRGGWIIRERKLPDGVSICGVEIQVARPVLRHIPSLTTFALLQPFGSTFKVNFHLWNVNISCQNDQDLQQNMKLLRWGPGALCILGEEPLSHRPLLFWHWPWPQLARSWSPGEVSNLPCPLLGCSRTA